MKFRTTLIFILLTRIVTAQDLPQNPKTGLVSIRDSINVKGKSLQEIKNILSGWGNTLMDETNLNTVFNLKNSKQTERIFISLPVENPVLTQDIGGNKFLVSGTLTYMKIKNSGLNQFAPVVVNNASKFSFSYIITPHTLIYEFTNFEYSLDGVHYGKYEDEKPPQDLNNRSIVFKMGKKEWKELKIENFTYFTTLASNLKGYVSTRLQNTHITSDQSPVNYESYKKIKTGMTYDEVIKILGDEGKELSNGNTNINGKTVAQQTIVWSDLDKTKNITITFADGKAVSKSQNNL